MIDACQKRRPIPMLPCNILFFAFKRVEIKREVEYVE